MMPLPHKFRLFTLRHRVSIGQWLLLVATFFCVAAGVFLITWGASELVDLYHERNQLKADAEIGKLALREEAWKKKEREAYIAEAKKTPWKKAILEAK